MFKVKNIINGNVIGGEKSSELDSYILQVSIDKLSYKKFKELILKEREVEIKVAEDEL